jgi:rfaE bifunctional protein nucleotidyltransferase chain/domain
MPHYQKITNKIHSWESMKMKKDEWKAEEKKLVFTNGCFDILHLGHIDYLSKAADLGDKFMIAVNSDESTRRLKGQNRPIQDEHARMMMLAAMEFVDAVVLFEEDTPKEIIEFIQPDVLVKGGDYSEETIVGADTVKKAGGDVHIIPFLEGYSTTSIEQKIKKS